MGDDILKSNKRVTVKKDGGKEILTFEKKLLGLEDE
jgi:hypothetical protein